MEIIKKRKLRDFKYQDRGERKALRPEDNSLAPFFY